MNILHISSHDLHGSRFNGYNLIGKFGDLHNVEMAVWKKTSTNNFVHQIPPAKSKILAFLTNIFIDLSSRFGFDRLLGFSGFILPFLKYYKRADIIHLQLIHSYSNFSILSLPKISKNKPVIWTLHDIWALTGGCEHSFECDKWMTGCKAKCPYPRMTSFFKKFTPQFHWKIKSKVYANSQFTLVVASEWMKEKVSLSPLLNKYPCYVIPFGINVNLFCPRDRVSLKKKFGIKPENQVIAFRDSGYLKDKFKGLKWLREALEIYQPNTPTTLLIFQDGSEFESLSHKYDIMKTGWIDGENLAEVLACSDIFLMPSLQESFGLMAIESMACGVPVIVFEGTSLPSIIKAPYGGLSVPARNSKALANSIKYLLENENERNIIAQQARNLVVSEYTDELYRQRHLALYQLVQNDFKKNN